MERHEDVEIWLAHDRKYKFHSNQFARDSTFFARLLTEENAITIHPSAAKAGVTTRWIIELQKLPNEKFPAGQLGLVKLENKARPQASTLVMACNENGESAEVTQLFDSYDTIFSAFYGTDFEVDGDMADAFQDAVDAIEIAEYLGCVRLISKPIEVAFFRQGQVLFRSITQRPWSWADMALKIKSEMLFKESLIHLVGNWAGLQSHVKEHMDPAIRKLCEKHVNELNRCYTLEWQGNEAGRESVRLLGLFHLQPYIVGFMTFSAYLFSEILSLNGSSPGEFSANIGIDIEGSNCSCTVR